MKAYKEKTNNPFCNYYGPPLATPGKEPNPYEHFYLNSVFHILMNLEGQDFEGTSLREKILNLFLEAKALDYEVDAPTEAIGDVFIEFQKKCDEFEEENDLDLLFIPTLPTKQVLMRIEETGLFENDETMFFGSPKTKSCMLETIIATIRNLEVTQKGEFTSDLVEHHQGFLDSYFKGKISKSFEEYSSSYSLQIKMSELMDTIRDTEGNTKILQSFVSYSAGINPKSAIYKSLTQRYLIVKLDFDGEELSEEDIEFLWESVDYDFNTNLLTSPCSEEHKQIDSNALLVATIDRLNKDTSTNNSETNILIDSKWRNFKHMIYKSNTFFDIIEDCRLSKRLPLILIYQLQDNVHKQRKSEFKRNKTRRSKKSIVTKKEEKKEDKKEDTEPSKNLYSTEENTEAARGYKNSVLKQTPIKRSQHPKGNDDLDPKGCKNCIIF
ncbi:unnamed protein product [Moneuplotes crassus]|uniref:Uncharacterized protein n=1 Tax=Euplotes crassus TaxID=5936 RepID=A0AAD1UC94_EUPCR|nr:unnamed protein product [Moneuplotes crassus]